MQGGVAKRLILCGHLLWMIQTKTNTTARLPGKTC